MWQVEVSRYLASLAYVITLQVTSKWLTTINNISTVACLSQHVSSAVPRVLTQLNTYTSVSDSMLPYSIADSPVLASACICVVYTLGPHVKGTWAFRNYTLNSIGPLIVLC